MRNILLFSTFILFFSTACSKDPRTPAPPPTRDVELKYYVDRFDLHYDGDYPERLEIRFEEINECDDDGACTAGYCLTDYDTKGKFREIAFDIAVWGTLSEVRKEALVFHEFGHCVLDRGHTDEDVISFMLPYLQSSTWYLENREEIYVELFGIGPIDEDDSLYIKPVPDPETETKHYLDL